MARRPLVVALAASLGAAIAFTCLYWPGVLYMDSYVRWDTARGLLGGGPRSSYLSIAPSLWMALAYGLTHEYAAYTLLQSFLFFSSTLLVLHRCAGFGSGALLATLALLAAVPLFGGYSAYHEGGVGAVVGLDLLLVLLVADPPRGAGATALHAAALFLAVFTVVGFRQNALTVLPAVAWLALRGQPGRAVAAARLGAMAAALAVLALLPRALDYQQEDASAVGPAWEIAQVLKRLDDPRYATYLDYAGSTRTALAGDLENNLWDGLFAPGALSFGALRIPAVARRVRHDYLRLLRQEPRAFLATKLHVVARVLGFGRPLEFVEFDEDRLGKMQEFGLRPSSARHRAFQRIHAFMAGARWLRRPWVVLAVAAALVALGGVARRRRAAAGDRAGANPDAGAARPGPEARSPAPAAGFAPVALLLAVLYYGAFLVTTQGYEFRYFFPALHLSLLAAAAATMDGARAVARSREQPHPPAARPA